MSASPLTDPASAQLGKPTAVQRWLLASGERAGARNALLVVQQGGQVKVLATVPVTEPPDRSLALVAERALVEKKVLVRADDNAAPGAPEDSEQSVYIGFSIRIASRPGAVVFRLQVSATDEDDAALLQRLAALVLRRAEDQLVGGAPLAPAVSSSTINETPSSAISAKAPEPDKPAELSESAQPTRELEAAPGVQQLVTEQGVLLSSVAALVDQPDLDQSLHSLATSAAQQFQCLRVYVGCVQGRQVTVRAVSGIVDFDQRSALLVDVAEAMTETQQLACTIRVPTGSEQRVPPQSHASLAEQLNNPALMSVPLIADDAVVGVLLLERDRAFDEREAAQLERLSLLLSPVLALKTTEAQSVGQWLRRFLARGVRSVFGARRSGLKLTLLCLALLAAWSATYTQMFRVDADAAVEATTQRAVVSGVASFLAQVEARAGDLVEAGDVLARLDAEDLELDRIRLQGEKDRLVKEYRANLAQRDRSKVRVLEAQRAQTQAKIDLLDAQIERATLRAPISGVVVSGDLLQSLGRPVERGELLFEVASLDDYRLVLSLDETDIAWVQPGSKGVLRLRSLTHRTFPFEVTSIAPVSESGEGANTFRVEAALQEMPDSLRPGMGGIAKIEVEDRAVGWIWTRSFVNWIRLQTWKYGGF